MSVLDLLLTSDRGRCVQRAAAEPIRGPIPMMRSDEDLPPGVRPPRHRDRWRRALMVGFRSGAHEKL